MRANAKNRFRRFFRFEGDTCSLTDEYEKGSRRAKPRDGMQIVMIVVFRSPYGRQIKSARWMPWPRTAKKDATNLRKASGRRFVACDPEISEWGNPPSLTWNPRGNARAKRTQGSETSQYLKEKRTIRVAFSSSVMFVRRERDSRDTPSSGERKGKSPNLRLRMRGL